MQSLSCKLQMDLKINEARLTQDAQEGGRGTPGAFLGGVVPDLFAHQPECSHKRPWLSHDSAAVMIWTSCFSIVCMHREP